MKKNLVSLLPLVVLLFASAFGQSKPDSLIPRRPPSPPLPPIEQRPPVIWINPEQGKLKAMQVQSVDVDVKIQGHLATTTMEMAFFNPNGRVLEGELIFPLGEGQTISGYALEVEGKLRQAVVVEKERGREIFEEIVRRGIDPGLAELTKGNVFRTRIYPIPANGTKRLSVTFEQELRDDGKGFRYLLPLAFADKVGKFHARAEVVKQEVAPVVEKSDGQMLNFEKWRDSFVAEITKENVAMDKALAFSVPKVSGRPQVYMVSDSLDPARFYFHARVEPETPPAPALDKPRRIALFYDASGSAGKRDRKREYKFLEAWCKTLGEVQIDVIAFRNDADKPVTVTVKDGKAGDLIKVLEDLPVDGGTSLGAVNVNAVPDADLAVLVSDGFTNFGPAEPVLARKDGRAVPLHVVHAAAMVDSANLERLARKGGGRVVSLLSASDEAGLAAVSCAPFQFLGAKVLSGRVEEISPGQPGPVNGGFAFAGRGDGKSEIELSFGYAGKVQVTRRITLNPGDAMEPQRGDFVRRAWAQQRIAELSLDPVRNEGAIIALGKEHRIVTSGTSLLVLDRIEDYVQHGIEPPEESLREKYLTLVKAQNKNPRAKDEASHLDEVAKQWTEFKEWHAKRHPWLETVLKPAAEREAAVYTALSASSNAKGQGSGSLSAEDAAAASALLAKARDLADRWRAEGKNDQTRAAWIAEASKIMLAVDVLRQRRLELMPQSEAAGRPDVLASGGSGSGEGSPALNRPRPATSRAAASSSMADGFAPGGAPASPVAPAAVMAPEPRLRESTATESKSAERSSAMSGSIEVKAWDPDTPYLKKLRKADDAYEAYLKERKDNGASSAFFLDCADYFREEKKDERLALRVLSNLAELELENAPLLRILAYRLQQLEKYELAVPLFEEVLKMRGEEPQSRRDLALCLSRME
ncbi:MAG TPA: VIT domain-containing protein, partial [Verrucomicrobium sp.]|nr:VIT domain-containing protein [Verrucomicrobium sp.]